MAFPWPLPLRAPGIYDAPTAGAQPTPRSLPLMIRNLDGPLSRWKSLQRPAVQDSSARLATPLGRQTQEQAEVLDQRLETASDDTAGRRVPTREVVRQQASGRTSTHEIAQGIE